MAALIWAIFYFIKKFPAMFSKEKMGQSFYTMGLLAIVLIAFIALCIWLLRVGF